jgi:hypothetical protein
MNRIELSQLGQEVTRLEAIAKKHPDPEVGRIIPILRPLSEALIRYSDLPYMMRRQGGQAARQYKVILGGVPHVFRYCHRVHAIQFKRRGQRGQIVRDIPAGSTERQIDEWIAALKTYQPESTTVGAQAGQTPD